MRVSTNKTHPASDTAIFYRAIARALSLAALLAILGNAPVASAAIPSAPQNLGASAGNGQVSLSWNAPSSNGGATITSYRVFRGTNSSNTLIVTSGSCANLGAVFSCTDTGLTNGQSYYYIVSAVNSAGQGPPSNGATATPFAAATIPGAPQSLGASAGNTQVSLSWNAPSSNGGATITSYRVFRGTNSSNTLIVTSGGCANLGATFSCTDTGLSNGQSYYYIVSAVNSAGQGPPSNGATATPFAAATIPSAPQNLGATPGNGQVSLSWSAPSSNGGATITSYRVFRGTNSANTLIVASGGCANLGAAFSCTDAAVTNGQSYYYIVSAVNSVGQGPPSNGATATPSGPATNIPGAPQNLGAFAGNGQVSLSWSAPSSDGGTTITSYRVFRGTNSANTLIITSGGCANLGAAFSCTDTSVSNGQSYYYIVSAVNSVGQGPPSNGATATPSGPATNIPGAPKNLGAFAGNGQVSLSWSAPSSDGGATITSYRVFRGTNSANTLIITSGGCANLGAAFSCTDTGVTNGQSYYYIVSAVNSVGQGPPSNGATATPSGPGTNIPGAPQNLGAFAGNGQVSLSWSAPSSDGGATITSYRVFRGTNSANTLIITSGGCANLGAAFSCTDTGVTNGQSYYYIVSAVNSVGQGPPSNGATATPAGATTSTLSITTTSLNPPTATVGVGYAAQQAVTATGGQAPYSWSATGLPSGMGINASTGAVFGTPTVAGTFNFTVTVLDSGSPQQTASRVLSITVSGATSTLSITTTSLNPPTATVGVGYAAQQAVTATGGQTPYSWSASGLPSGMGINASTGAVFGTPTVAGTFNFTVTVLDSSIPRQSVSKVLSITVLGSTSTLSITTTSLNPPTATVGIGYAAQQPVTATGGQTPYTWSASGLPSGMAINATTGAVFGTPTVAGAFNFTVTVQDSGSTQQNASKVLSITVTGATSTLSITTTSLNPSTATVGVGYAAQQAVTATGGQTPYTWSTSGLPNGMAINATTGAVFGTPTVAGTFNFTVTVQDSSSPQQNASRVLSITVSGATSTLSITTTSLSPPTATVGLGYAAQQTVTATGGQTPYTWSASGLPSGMAINATTGAVFGTPTVAGTFNITVTVQDSSSPRQTASKVLSLFCGSAQPTCALNCSADVPASGNVGASLSFVATSSSSSCTGTVTQSWTFGDGKTGSGASVTHAYSNAGIYNWTLTTSQGDSTCVRNGTVSIGTAASGLPTIDYFRASHDQIAIGGTSDLTWSVHNASLITLDGSGNVAAISATTVAPTSTTTYKLTATNSAGSQTATLTVRVDSTLSVSIHADRVTGTAPLAITFTILVSGGVPPYRYLWSFGDTSIGIGGSLTALPLPHHRACGSAHGGSAGYAGRPSR